MDLRGVVEHISQALWMLFALAGPALLVILVVGFVVGILQAATSISDSGLSFLPKLLFLVLTLMLMAPWGLGLFLDYLRRVLQAVAELS